VSVPSSKAEPDRYQGNPLLIVLENYVLAAIGALPKERTLATSKVVQRLLGGGPDWMATVRERLALDRSLDGDLRTLWARNQRIAKGNGEELLPAQFARLVADENFAELLGKPSE
jgi:hypothetical protein